MCHHKLLQENKMISAKIRRFKTIKTKSQEKARLSRYLDKIVQFQHLTNNSKNK